MSSQDLAQSLQQFGDWAVNSGLKIIVILLVLWLFRLFGEKLVTRLVKNSIRPNSYASRYEEEQREKTLIGVIGSLMKIVLRLVAGLMIINEVGVELGPILAGASVFGAIIGFGSQSIIKDFTAGLFVILENQYRVGDIVSIAGITGRVVNINIRDTVLRDLDGHIHYIPNGAIGVATNMTKEYSGVKMKIGVGYDTDINKAKKVIDDIGAKMAQDPDWQNIIIDPLHFVRVNDFSESSVELLILGKVTPAKQWKVAGEFRHLLKKAFDKNQIVIPFPQLVMHKGSRAHEDQKKLAKKNNATKKIN